jgi:replication initiation protein RepC
MLAVQTKNEQINVADKWDILAHLTAAAEIYELNHRTLGVLKALMTFLPGRIIDPSHLGAIVFPSNRTLSNRLNGMPDSTLRRHLARLVQLGIVNRHESANRKRFARKVGQGIQIAFGFDLSPLARQQAAIEGDAIAAKQTHDALLSLRSEVAHLRQRHIDQFGQSALSDDIARALRRKPETDELAQIKENLTKQMSAFDGQNERHIHNEFINNSDSQKSIETIQSNDQTVTLEVVVETCKEFKAFFPEPVRNWHTLIGIADRLTTMIGIDQQVFKEAIDKLGVKGATIAVLCILEKLGSVQNPGGYLRSLSQSATSDQASCRKMLNWAQTSKIVS